MLDILVSKFTNNLITSLMKPKKSPAISETLVKKIQKRDGSIVPFDSQKIVGAIHKAMIASGEGSLKEAEIVANKVYADALRITKKYRNFIPNVEGIQDTVEKELILSEYVKTAKAYILYRDNRAKLRARGSHIPPKVRKLAEESKKY
jgi:anaerobic ribonucleoside-triphosphate reductase